MDLISEDLTWGLVMRLLLIGVAGAVVGVGIAEAMKAVWLWLRGHSVGGYR